VGWIAPFFLGIFPESLGYKHAYAFGGTARFPRTEGDVPPNLFFACVRTRTRVCACGVSVWIVCIQVVPDKKNIIANHLM
jgi:hypothetical protein